MGYVAVLAEYLVFGTATAGAFWELSYSDWKKSPLAQKIGYLSGFLQGHLL